MKQRTQEEKTAYFKDLRAQWHNAKLLAQNNKEIEAIIANHGLQISSTGFMFVSAQMKQLGLDGLPYLDAKTYKGWKENGFQVAKGEKSNIKGITWVTAQNKDNEDDSFRFPKVYHLFHRSQVEEIH